MIGEKLRGKDVDELKSNLTKTEAETTEAEIQKQHDSRKGKLYSVDKVTRKPPKN